MDAAGNLYGADCFSGVLGANDVQDFAAGAKGNIAPIQTPTSDLSREITALHWMTPGTSTCVQVCRNPRFRFTWQAAYLAMRE